MQCPQCGARTEVNEKRGPFRDRRCTNSACGIDFTTREHVLPQHERSRCARTRAVKIGIGLCPATAGPEQMGSATAGGADETAFQNRGAEVRA
jgi:hypothetical protein